ncbi:MAG: flagellar basal body-associated FliL family protein [Pseudomonadota bacterium]
MKKILIFLLVPLFAVGGAGAGFMLKPPVEMEMEEPSDDDAPAKAVAEMNDLSAQGEPAQPQMVSPPLASGPPEVDYVKLDKQFVVPLVDENRVGGLMIITMALETEPGATDLVFAHEPKLRDEFLQVLFTHAQSGGFSGSFTDLKSMEDLRLALNATARSVLGDVFRSVLLTNMIRQDL